MALKDLVIPSIKVSVPNSDPLVVRGLGLDSIIYLLRIQQAPLQSAYDSVTNGGDSLDVNSIAASLLVQAPDLVAHIIACAVSEPDEWETVRNLPAPVQLELLEAAGILTFAVEGGPKKVLETVIRLMGGVTNALDSRSAQANGLGVSDDR